MQITNNANALNSAAARLKSADLVSNVNDKTNKAEQLQSDNSAQQVTQRNRFDVDQQAILVFENQRDNSAAQVYANNPKDTFYDQPSNKNQTAVAAYQAVDNIAERASIQQSFGIDILA